MDDDFLNKKTEDKDEVLETTKIEFKFFKEKRTTRTYIYNLEHFITDPDILKTVLKKLKKSLGTACTKKDTEFGLAYGFNGDFRKRIAQELIASGIVSADDFKKSDLK